MPLRSELFSADQMEQHGATLANWHKLSPNRGPDRLLSRLSENEQILTSTCDLLTETIEADRPVTLAGEWLLDNFYLIEEQIRTAKQHLPRGYSRELPRLLNGHSAGLPRVYDIALETISHGDGRVDLVSLSRFITAYQSVSPLNLGELWAIPIMLRLALIENLRRVGALMSAQKIDIDLADRWAEQMMNVAESDPKSLILVIADMARSNPPMQSTFVSELARRLQGQGSALALPLTWVEQRLSESGLTIEQLVQSETQQQAANQVSISNSISSLRLLGSMNWQTFVEENSLVEKILHEDPDGTYGLMTFATRDYYRHIVENMSKSTNLSESDLARLAINLARASADNKGADSRAAHVGFYLIDKGLPELERAAQVHYTFVQSLRKLFNKLPFHFYIGTIVLLTAVFAASFWSIARSIGLSDSLLLLVGIALTVALSQLALNIANTLSMLVTIPHALPKMDFAEGIPADNRTLVVVPTLLTSPQGIEHLLESLEVRFLANRDDNMHFGLLTDFTDAQTQTLPGDESLLALVQKGIVSLNEKYHSGSDIFFLFHRPRLWNAQEKIWMGHERKRGKLADLNQLLRGSSGDKFSSIVGDTKVLANTRYVITLDTDTLLPRESARQFVGAMAHPLNRPRYDAAKQLVIEGYAILQPRVAVSLPRVNRTLYAKLFGSESGIDPYTRTVSDVYQDLFQEGSFIGKGIYDVDAFELALKDRFPDNRILSHDLLEGCYARSGLLSDVQLYEEYPARYSSDVSRRYRWMRGDWQLLDWLLPSVPLPDGRRALNPTSPLSRWKIFDNLRRSLVSFSLTVLFILGWTVLSPALFWTLSVVALFFLSPVIAVILELFRKPENMLISTHLDVVMRSAGLQFSQALFNLVCLPYEACFSVDAVVRTCWRMLISHKGLLQWSASGDANRSDTGELSSSYKIMVSAPIVAGITGGYLLYAHPNVSTCSATSTFSLVCFSAGRLVAQSTDCL